MIAYYDTSALVPLLVEEPGTEVAARTWTSASRVASSELSGPELHAAVAAAIRGGRLAGAGQGPTRESVDGVLAQLTRLPASSARLRLAADLAWAHGLRGYDAVHLASALSSPAEVLVAGDRPLLDAATREGLAVVDTGTDATARPGE